VGYGCNGCGNTIPYVAILDDEVAGAVEICKVSRDNPPYREKVIEFRGMGNVAQVRTDKRTITADLVIMAVEAKPNAQLAKDAGLLRGKVGKLDKN
jgi:hypothetical protein